MCGGLDVGVDAVEKKTTGSIMIHFTQHHTAPKMNVGCWNRIPSESAPRNQSSGCGGKGEGAIVKRLGRPLNDESFFLPVWDISCHGGRVIVNVAGHGFEKIGQMWQIYGRSSIYCC
jgi:hypothetical protein